MKLIILLMFISSLSFSRSTIDWEVKAPKNLVKFEILYGKPVETYKNIRHYKFKNKEIVITVNENVLTRAEFRFFKSDFSYNSLKTQLSSFNYVKTTGHNSGSEIILMSKNQTIRFFNNSKKSLKAYTITWP